MSPSDPPASNLAQDRVAPRDEGIEATMDGKGGKFLCGVAMSVWQNSGAGADGKTNWDTFQRKKLNPFNVRSSFVAKKHQPPGEKTAAAQAAADAPGKIPATELGEPTQMGMFWAWSGMDIKEGANFWDKYEQDIQAAKDLGCNSFRVSIEWSRIVPKRGQINMEAILRYHRIFDTMERLGLEPNVCLHWFVHPQWFEDLGEFNKDENAELFGEWAQIAFSAFGSRVRLWSTFNEPSVAACCGHVAGNHPPGQSVRFGACAQKLKVMMKAHRAAYDAIKAMPGGDKAQVGITHHVLWWVPKHEAWYYCHVRAVTDFMNYAWAVDAVTRYLREGVLDYRPLGFSVAGWFGKRWRDPAGRPPNDFVGINHYSRGVVDWKLNPSSMDERSFMSDMALPVEPQSLYDAIEYLSQLGLPMYVTENGLAYSCDDVRRPIFIAGALHQVERAVADGYDLRGYMYWTLLDDFEWNVGYEMRQGLYEFVQEDPARQRKLRQGSLALKEWYEVLPEKLGAMQAAQRAQGLAPRQAPPMTLHDVARRGRTAPGPWHRRRQSEAQPGREAPQGTPQPARVPVRSGAPEPKGGLRARMPSVRNAPAGYVKL